MPVIKFFKGLTPLGRIISALITVVLVVLVVSFVRDLIVGNTEVIADIETERAGAAVSNAQDAFEDLAEIEATRERHLGVVEATEAAISAAETQAEKDSLAAAAMCEIDPAYCEKEE